MSLQAIEICYLSCVALGTAMVATGDGSGHWYTDADSRHPVEPAHIAPTVAWLDIPDGYTVTATWGDRIKRGDTPRVYGTRGGQSWCCDDDGAIRVDGYWVDEPELQRLAAEWRSAVAEAWAADIDARPEVAAAVEHYRYTVLDRLDREHADHRRRWDLDRQAIARRFGRAWVSVDEQTAPGTCCVRSVSGTLLGYAHVMDGRWLGTVEII